MNIATKNLVGPCKFILNLELIKTLFANCYYNFIFLKRLILATNEDDVNY
jgi:hypothetical protein